jgi:hypothetical protein
MSEAPDPAEQDRGHCPCPDECGARGACQATRRCTNAASVLTNLHPGRQQLRAWMAAIAAAMRDVIAHANDAAADWPEDEISKEKAIPARVEWHYELDTATHLVCRGYSTGGVTFCTESPLGERTPETAWRFD